MNAGVLAFDAAGRITTLAVADFPSPHFNGGTPTGDLGSLVISATGDNYLDGIAYDDAGAIKVAEGSAVVSPTLDLDFTSGKLDKRLTFTRNSPASYVDAQGTIRYAGVNIPRFEAKGLLIEESRTQVMLYSQDFSNGVWIKDNCAVEPGEPSPDGGRDGFTVRPTTAGTANRLVRQPYLTSTQGTFTASIYVKRGTIASNGVTLRVRDNTSTNDARMPFNLVNPIPPVVATSGTWVAGAGAAEPIGDGWYRLTMSFTTNTSYTSLTLEAWLYSYTGSPDTTGTIIVWGAQLEAGAFPTSYMPTTGATFTRGDDFCAMPISGVPGYNAAEWSAFTAFSIQLNGGATAPNISNYPFSFFDEVIGGFNGYGVRERPDTTTNTPEFLGRIASTIPTASFNPGGYVVANQVRKVACAMSSVDLTIKVNGVAGGTVPNTVFGQVTPSLLTIGKGETGGSGTRFLCGHLQQFSYYPTRLSDAALLNLSATGSAFNFSGGLPISTEGALLVSYDQTPVDWVAGFPLDANGLVCLATPTPPIDLSAFSNGFSAGFQ